MASLESIKTKLQGLIDSANAITGNNDTMLASAVNTLVEGYGQGDASDCHRYITFMSCDNNTIVEEIAIEPTYSYSISSAPLITKASTVDTVYTHSGWSLTPDGEEAEVDYDNLTEDLTLYPLFDESTRYYTVYFYNGTSLIGTDKVPYGGTSTYTYKIDGAWFLGWNPTPENVTSTMKCYGTWDYTEFATASWERIAEIAKSGEASNYYNIGDSREITLSNGETIGIEIASFDSDIPVSETADNYTTYSGIKFITRNALSNSKMLYCDTVYSTAFKLYNYEGFYGSKLNTYLNETVLPMLPSDLLSVLPYSCKFIEYNKQNYSGSALRRDWFKLWVPSVHEVFGVASIHSSYSSAADDPLDIFRISPTSDDINELRIRTLKSSGDAIDWWTSSPSSDDPDECTSVVRADGSIDHSVKSNEANAYVVFAFCL